MIAATPAKRIRQRGTVESRHDADALLERPGDVVLVDRGRPRSLVFACPDGCGSVLTINLDPRTGKAWRMYRRGNEISLHPSVWRDNGCGAHFILWRDQLLWCGPRLQGGDEPPYHAGLEAAVLASLTEAYRSADDIADLLSEIPWEITRAADRLVRNGKAEAKRLSGSKHYRLNQRAAECRPAVKSMPEVDPGIDTVPAAPPLTRWARFVAWLGL
jgi:hypothetical protein